MTEKLLHRSKLLYGVGDTSFSITSTIIGLYFAIFLTDVIGLSPGVVAAAIFIGRSWDYINDPFVGYLSDRTRSRWGRRRPFLLFGTIPFALAFTLMWWRPPLDNQVVLTIYYTIAYILFDTAGTFVYMPYYSLTPELTSNYDERTSLNAYRAFFSIVGSLISFTIPLIMVGTFTPENSGKVFLMGIIFAAFSALPLFTTFLGTHERPEHQKMEQPGLRQSIRAALKNPPFIYSSLLSLLNWVAVDIIGAILLYFLKYALHREAISDLIFAVIFITAILVLPFWTWVSRIWEKRWAYISGVGFMAIVLVTLVSLDAGVSDLLIYTLAVLAGIGVSVAHVLPWSIIPDAIEWDEWKTGTRHEGMFYSLISLMQKIASSVAIPLILLVLQFTGYQPNVPQQTANALLGIRFAAGPIPALFLFLGMFCAYKYPLTREKYTKICKELEERRKGQTPHAG